MTSTGGGKKFDAEKVLLALIPPAALDELGRALTHGARKYGQANYLEGLSVTRLISAAMRHLRAYMRGEEIDLETGADQVHHLGEALASIAMLLDCRECDTLVDDRPQRRIDALVVDRVVREVNLMALREMDCFSPSQGTGGG